MWFTDLDNQLRPRANKREIYIYHKGVTITLIHSITRMLIYDKTKWLFNLGVTLNQLNILHTWNSWQSKLREVSLGVTLNQYLWISKCKGWGWAPIYRGGKWGQAHLPKGPPLIPPIGMRHLIGSRIFPHKTNLYLGVKSILQWRREHCCGKAKGVKTTKGRRTPLPPLGGVKHLTPPIKA